MLNITFLPGEPFAMVLGKTESTNHHPNPKAFVFVLFLLVFPLPGWLPKGRRPTGLRTGRSARNAKSAKRGRRCWGRCASACGRAWKASRRRFSGGVGRAGGCGRRGGWRGGGDGGRWTRLKPLKGGYSSGFPFPSSAHAGPI